MDMSVVRQSLSLIVLNGNLIMVFYVGNLNNESIFPQYHKHQLLSNFFPLDSVSCAKLQALRKGKCQTDFVSGCLLKFG